MTKIGRSVIAALVLGILCRPECPAAQKKEGPMERTGKEIDKVARENINKWIKQLKSRKADERAAAECIRSY